MAKKETFYETLDNFPVHLNRLIINKEFFEVQETSYTKKIRTPEYTILFNETGKQDKNVLHLINKVRNDASVYSLFDNPIPERQIDFFNLTERPPGTVVSKIDIRAAYWETALRLGVISRDTDYLLNEMYEGKNEQLKVARLKALGSLATKKTVTTYEDGEPVCVEQNTQATKPIYMYICSEIDEVMKEVTSEIRGAFYYWWDCIFVHQKVEKDVIEYIKQMKYATKVETTRDEIVQVGNRKYIRSLSDNKQYLIRPETSFILST